MERTVGYRGKRILFVSDSPCTSQGVDCMAVPASLDAVPGNELLQSYCVWKGSIVVARDARDPRDMRVALVSNYKAPCGISTYSEWLYGAIAPLVGGHRIFAEHLDGAAAEPNVVRCWRRGEAPTELVARIREYDPDVVLIQHEYGIFPNARHWLSLLSQLNRYKVVVTLHSVYRRHYDKMVCEMAIPEMIVHTAAGGRILTEEHKVPGKVHVIPHGSPRPEPEPKVWNMYRSEHTFIQFGFGFKYKGWETSIELASRLKAKYPDVFFTGIFSESPFSGHLHNAYYAELEAMIERLGVQDNVGMIRGFAPEHLLMNALRMNKAAVFPYIDNGEHTVYGCSGAARLAMRACVPVIGSHAPLFDDLDGVVPRASTIDEAYSELCSLFDDPGKRAEHVARQNAFLEATSWENVARAYVSVFSNP